MQETAFSVDLLARRALKLQAESDALKATKNTSDKSISFKEEGHTTAHVTRSAYVHLVAEIEEALIKEVAVSDLPSFRVVSNNTSTVFDGMVFWVKGYNQEVTLHIASLLFDFSNVGNIAIVADDGLYYQLHFGRRRPP